MALVTLSEVLKLAEEKQTAIPSFNIDNIEGTQAIMEAVEMARSPIILTIGQGAIRAGMLWPLSDVVRRVAADSSLPVVMNLDHGASFEQVVTALRAGFTSVMYDGSHKPLEENIRESQAVVRAAHAVGVSVECELGAVPGVEDGHVFSNTNLVDLTELETFVSKVDCDALAVGIGNVHGISKAVPKLDFDRLTACSRLKTPPLVLHGGSGIPDEMVKKAIQIGIRKVNVASELRAEFLRCLKASDSGDFYASYKQAKQGVTDLAVKKIRLIYGA